MSADLSFIFCAAAIALRDTLSLNQPRVRNLAIHAADQLGLPPEPEKFSISRLTWQRVLKKARDPSCLQTLFRILADPRCWIPHSTSVDDRRRVLMPGRLTVATRP
jgi:hypothetical protein